MLKQLFQQTNRYTAALRKLLSIKGERADVSFGVHLEDERPEFSFVKGERLWVQLNQVTSAAGTLSQVGVCNPAGSGVLVVVTNAFCDVTADADVALVFSQNGVGVGGLWARDGRWFQGSVIATTCRAIARALAAVGGTAQWAILKCTARVPQDFLVNVGRVPPVVLAPGNELYLSVTAVGVNTLTATFAGYERSLESGETIPG